MVATLTALSNLSSEELKLFGEVWQGIEVKRRRQIVRRLIRLVVKNVTLNFDDLFRICLRDHDPVVRVKGIEGLWECEDCTLIRLLIEMLNEDSDEAVRAAAASALSRFALLAELRKVPLRHVAKISEALFSVIDNPQERVELRRCAIEAVAPLSSPPVKEVIDRAYRSRELNLKISALRAMGRNSDPYWLPILLKELTNPHLEVRVEAVRACGELGEEKVVPHLSRLIADAQSQVRCAAIEALGKIGRSEARQLLHPYSGSADEQISSLARKATEETEFEDDFLPFNIEFRE